MRFLDLALPASSRSVRNSLRASCCVSVLAPCGLAPLDDVALSRGVADDARDAEAEVLLELGVLGGDDGLLQLRRDRLVGDDLAPLDRELADHLAARAVDARDRARRVVVERGDLRQVAGVGEDDAGRDAEDRGDHEEDDEAGAAGDADDVRGHESVCQLIAISNRRSACSVLSSQLLSSGIGTSDLGTVARRDLAPWHRHASARLDAAAPPSGRGRRLMARLRPMVAALPPDGAAVPVALPERTAARRRLALTLALAGVQRAGRRDLRRTRDLELACRDPARRSRLLRRARGCRRRVSRRAGVRRWSRRHRSPVVRAWRRYAGSSVERREVCALFCGYADGAMREPAPAGVECRRLARRPNALGRRGCSGLSGTNVTASHCGARDSAVPRRHVRGRSVAFRTVPPQWHPDTARRPAPRTWTIRDAVGRCRRCRARLRAHRRASQASDEAPPAVASRATARPWSVTARQ